MIEELIKGKRAIDFSIMEHGFCSMQLSEGYTLSIETLCRFVGLHGAFLTSQDHGELFGLQAPLDTATSIADAIKGKVINEVVFSEDTGDLILTFSSGRFEILCSSSGYECYQISGPDNLIIVVYGGGNRAEPMEIRTIHTA